MTDRGEQLNNLFHNMVADWREKDERYSTTRWALGYDLGLSSR
jgi:hypothetical protein